MVQVTYSAVIEQPVEFVFRVAADPEEQLKWDRARLKSVEKLSSGPLVAGARYRGRFKGMGQVEYDYEDYDPPRKFTHRSRLPIGTMRHTFTFEPTDGGTRMTQQGTLEPTMLGRLAGPIVGRMLNKRFSQIAAEIDKYLGRRSHAG